MTDNTKAPTTLLVAALLTTEEAASYLNLAAQTLRRWRVTGESLPFVRLGDGPKSAIRYRRADLDEWIEARLVRPATAVA